MYATLAHEWTQLTFQAGIRRQRVLYSTGSEEEPDLLEPRVPPGQRHLYRHGYSSGLQASVERAHEVDRIVVGVHKGHPIAGLNGVVSGEGATAAAL